MFRVSSGHVVKFIKSYTICLSFLEQTEKTWFLSDVVVDFSLCYSCALAASCLCFIWKQGSYPSFGFKKLWNTEAFFAARRVLQKWHRFLLPSSSTAFGFPTLADVHRVLWLFLSDRLQCIGLPERKTYAWFILWLDEKKELEIF